MKRHLLTTTCFLPLALSVNAAYGLPVHEQTISGSISLDSSQTNILNIHQTTNNALVNWRDFGIDMNEQVNVFQPNSSSILLNRVIGENPSNILGNLNANGHVWIMNPSGVLFGDQAQVNVGGLIATTAGMSNERFLSGDYHFDQAGNANATIINKGTINAHHGVVGLLAPQVSNHGTINAHFGKVTMAATETFAVDFYGDGLFNFVLDGLDETSAQSDEYSVKNTGNIIADAGRVELTVAQGNALVERTLDHSWGTIQANSVGVNHKGQIVLGGGNKTTTYIQANVNATGHDADEKGGDITITGEKIALLNATVDASGTGGGGTIKIGGDYQGQGDTPTATRAHINRETYINADAIEHGDGGQVIVWSDDQTDFYGTISAQGGAHGGDGGFVETSGKRLLIALGDVIANSPLGKAGQWLLDPNNITIQTGVDGADVNITETPGPPDVFATNADSAIVTTGSIEAALDAGTDVTIQTSAGGVEFGDITIGNNINKTAGGDATLTLKAHRNIINTAGADITSTMGVLNLILNADSDADNVGAIDFRNSTITTNGGNFTAGGGANPLTTAAHAGQDGVYDIGVAFSNVDISAGAGDISIRGEGEDTGDGNRGIDLDGGTTLITTTGSIILHGTGGTADASNAGTSINSTDITTTSGNIDITGIANTTGVVGMGSNKGFRAVGGSDITSTDGNITIIGTAGAGDGSNAGVEYNGGSIHSTNGAINITATAASLDLASSRQNHGLALANNHMISTTGGSIVINATAGGGEDENHGIFMRTSSSITAVNGSINVTGTSGGGVVNGEDRNYGIAMQEGSSITSTGLGGTAATVTVTGIGTNNGDTQNHGIYMDDANTRITSELGAVNITGTGGSDGAVGSNDNYGIYLFGTAQIRTTDGSLTMNGTGGAGDESNYGIYLDDTGTNITASAGVTNITGIGGADGTNGDDNNHGIYLNDNAQIVSTNATMTINGTGTSNSNAGSSRNFGVYLRSSAQITSTSGTLNINGTGGDGEDSNYGVYTQLSSSISTDSADLNIIGQGGTRGGAGSAQNYGIHIENSSISTTSGNIDMDGTGAAGANENHGVLIANAGTTISADEGSISIDGTGGAGTSNNLGIRFTGGTISSNVAGVNAATISISGTGGNGTLGTNSGFVASGGAAKIIRSIDGDISLTGTGAAGAAGNNNQGINLADSITIQSTNDANITITGIEGANTSIGITETANPVIIGETGGDNMLGDITIITDSLDLSATTTLVTDGVITIEEYTDGNTMGLGAGAGDLSINNTELGLMTAGSFIFGGTNGTDGTSGNMAINTTRDFGDLNVTFRSGADIDLAGTLTKATGAGTATYNFQADNHITNSASADITAGSGNITLAMTTDVDNNATGALTLVDGDLSLGAGTATFTTDGFTIDAASSVTTTGAVTIKQETNAATIGVGAGAGTLSVSDAELGVINAGSFVFGDANSGTLTFNSAHNFTGGDMSLYGASIDLQSNLDAGTNTLLLDAATGDINANANTLSATSLNLDAATTIVADINATNVDINNNATGATLTGIANGGADQAAADSILGGPGNDTNYKFEGYTIRYVAPPSSPPVTPPTVDPTPPVTPPEDPTPPVTPPEDPTPPSTTTSDDSSTVVEKTEAVINESETIDQSVTSIENEWINNMVLSDFNGTTSISNGSLSITPGINENFTFPSLKEGEGVIFDTGGFTSVTKDYKPVVGDFIMTGATNGFEFEFDENSIIKMTKNSRAQVQKVLFSPDGKPSTYLDVKKGAVGFYSDRNKHKGEIKSILPGIAIKVTGTCYIVDYDDVRTKTDITLFGGGIELYVKGQLLKLKFPIQLITFSGKSLAGSEVVKPIKIDMNNVRTRYKDRPDFIPTREQLLKCGVPETEI